MRFYIMKKKILLHLLIVSVFASCIDKFSELMDSTYTGFSVDEAKTAFEKEAEALEVRPFTTSSSTRNGKKVPTVTPLWKKGEVFTNKDGIFVMVPLNVPLVKTFVRKQKDAQLPDDEKYYNTDIRLLIQKKQKNEYLYTIVYITGNLSYIIEKRRNIKLAKLDNLDAFSGEIRYFSLKGGLLWGEIYREGEKIGMISAIDAPTVDSNKKVQTRGYEIICESYMMETETCYHYGYDMGEGYIENGVDCFYDYSWEEHCYEEWVDETGCPYCGAPGCNGECQNTDGVPTETAITAKKIFRNSNMTEANWRLIDRMLEKIKLNCMGDALVNGLFQALNGSTLSIQFTDQDSSGFHFGTSAGISLSMETAESNILFHEMWHAYQAYQETQTSYVSSLMNQEIEAHYAQYLYLQSLPEYSGSKWEDGYKHDSRLRGTAALRDYVDNKGSLKSGVHSTLLETFTEETLVPVFRKIDGYKNYSYDKTRIGLTNFSNLQELTVNC